MVKKTLLLVTIIFALSSIGWAGACSTGTLAMYDTAGFSCTIDLLTFSNFSYTQTATGGASLLDSGIAVSPIVIATNEVGFSFSGPWHADSNQTEDSLINFIVSGTHILGSSLSGNGTATGTGTGFVSETTSPIGFMSSGITNEIYVSGGASGTCDIPAFSDTFTSPTPEPCALLLMGSFLGLVGFIRRRLI